MNADQVKALLGLEPNPSCGFTTPTYHSPLRVETPRGPRDGAFAQYFLVAPDRATARHPAFANEITSFGAGGPQT